MYRILNTELSVYALPGCCELTTQCTFLFQGEATLIEFREEHIHVWASFLFFVSAVVLCVGHSLFLHTYSSFLVYMKLFSSIFVDRNINLNVWLVFIIFCDWNWLVFVFLVNAFYFQWKILDSRAFTKKPHRPQ